MYDLYLLYIGIHRGGPNKGSTHGSDGPFQSLGRSISGDVQPFGHSVRPVTGDRSPRPFGANVRKKSEVERIDPKLSIVEGSFPEFTFGSRRLVRSDPTLPLHPLPSKLHRGLKEAQLSGLPRSPPGHSGHGVVSAAPGGPATEPGGNRLVF